MTAPQQRTYHLLWHPEQNTLVIDDHVKVGYESQKHVRATCWIHAKQKLGFDLTPLQKEMLDEKNNRNKTNRGTVANIEDARKKLRPADVRVSNWRETGPDTGDGMQQVLRDEGVLQRLQECGDSGSTAATLGDR